MIGWLLVYRLCRYWNRMELRAAAPEGKTESWEPSPEEIRKFKWKRFAVFVVLAAAAILSVVALLLTFADSSDILSIVFEWALEILSILFEWFLVYRLWRYWKRMALHAPVPEPDGKDRLLKLVGKYYLERGKNAEVVKLYEGADISEAYPEDLVILALANVRLGNYETALKFYNDKRLASVSIKNLAADFPGIDTPNHLEASLLRIFVQS
jgi:tetratricopeptide (TPR) repeat protein